MAREIDFDKLYDRIVKITNLSTKIPLSMWDEVFETLYKAALNDNGFNEFEQEILTKSKSSGLIFESYVDIEKLKSKVDKSLCYAFYLDMIKIKTFKTDHIAACYSLFDNTISAIKLAQNLRDLASNKYGYLKAEGDGYSITELGKTVCISKSFLKKVEEETD